jgi:PadR family transcriptional regulator AphA
MNNNDSDISLLGFLAVEPMHGYDLHKQVTDLSGFGIVWNIKIGKLYAMLNRLEKEDYIRSTTTKEGNRPARNKFSITEKGKKTFATWSVSPVNRGREFRITFLLKLYFSIRTGSEQANKLIDSQIETCNSWLSVSKAMVNKNKKAKAAEMFPGIVNAYRKIQIQGYLSWLDWCKESLKEGNK